MEPLAECLDVSLLELMQGEQKTEPQLETGDAVQVLADTVACSEREEERRNRMWKIRLQLCVCGLGGCYLISSGLFFLLRLNGNKALAVSKPGTWYENPVLFYLWVGIVILGFAAAAFYLLWKNDRPSTGVRIGRHRVKGLLTILMDILVVLLLHTYMTGMAENQEQLNALSEAIPIKAAISNNNGSLYTDLDIPETIVQGLLDSVYVKDLKLTVQLKADAGYSDPENWDTLDYLYGVNCMAAVPGFEADSVVWNAGMDDTVFDRAEAYCVVSAELMEERGWKLGDRIELEQYYFYRGGYGGREIFLDPLESLTYEIAGYSDMKDISMEDTGWVYPDILVPLHAVRECYVRQGIPFTATSAGFVVQDTLHLNEFKQEMRDLGLKNVAPMAQRVTYEGNVLNLNDSAFIGAASRLMELLDTVRAFFPFLLGLIVCVGYLVTLLLLHGRKQEMALLRSIGVSRTGCFLIFFKEQLLLAAAGVFAGSLLAVLLQGNHGGGSVMAGCLVGVCYMLGNGLALWKLFTPFEDSEYEIVGMYGGKESGSMDAYSMGYNEVIIPSASVKNSDGNNIVIVGPMQGFNTSFQIENGSIESYMEKWTAQGIDNVEITFYDRGYTKLSAGMENMKSIARILVVMGAVMVLMVLAYFTWLFILRQGDRTAIERSLGFRKSQSFRSMFFGIFLLILAGSAVGCTAGSALAAKVAGSLNHEAYFDTDFGNSAAAQLKAEQDPEADIFYPVRTVAGTMAAILVTGSFMAAIGIGCNLRKEPMELLGKRRE